MVTWAIQQHLIRWHTIRRQFPFIPSLEIGGGRKDGRSSLSYWITSCPRPVSKLCCCFFFSLEVYFCPKGWVKDVHFLRQLAHQVSTGVFYYEQAIKKGYTGTFHIISSLRACPTSSSCLAPLLSLIQCIVLLSCQVFLFIFEKWKDIHSETMSPLSLTTYAADLRKGAYSVDNKMHVARSTNLL